MVTSTPLLFALVASLVLDPFACAAEEHVGPCSLLPCFPLHFPPRPTGSSLWYETLSAHPCFKVLLPAHLQVTTSLPHLAFLVPHSHCISLATWPPLLLTQKWLECVPERNWVPSYTSGAWGVCGKWVHLVDGQTGLNVQEGSKGEGRGMGWSALDARGFRC